MTSSITPSRVWPRAWLFLSLLLLPLLAPAAPGVPPLPTLTVRVLEGTDASVLDDLVNVRPVKGQAPAMLQFDLAHKRVLNGSGQIVADSDAKNPINLQGTVDKWRYVQPLQALAAAHPQEMHLEFSGPLRQPSPPAFYKGEKVNFVVTNVTPERQLAVFDLSPIGTLTLLYPEEDPSGEVPNATMAVEGDVLSPFGVDHVVAVSAADPAGMRALIAWLAETARANGMLDSKGAFLDQVLGLRNVRVGIVATFTCLSAANCKR